MCVCGASGRYFFKYKATNMNLEKLKIFYQVACAEKLQQASENLNKTKSALSKSISSFEEELGEKLFTRSAKGLQLTKSGNTLFGLAKHIVNEVQNVQYEISEEKREESGNLKIIAATGFSSVYLPPMILDFMKRYPKVVCDLHPPKSKKISHLLEGDILINSRLEGLSGYKQIPLVELPLKLYASREYLEKHGIPKNFSDLKNHKLIGYSGNTPLLEERLNWFTYHGKPILKVDESFGRCRAAGQGIGIISVPKIHPQVKEYDLVEILPGIEGPGVTYHIIVDSSLLSVTRVRAFVDGLISHFDSLS